jgi:hypothetical protein
VLGKRLRCWELLLEAMEVNVGRGVLTSSVFAFFLNTPGFRTLLKE